MRANPLGGGFQVSSNLNSGRDICRNTNFTVMYSGKCLQSQLPRRPREGKPAQPGEALNRAKGKPHISKSTTGKWSSCGKLYLVSVSLVKEWTPGKRAKQEHLQCSTKSSSCCWVIREGAQTGEPLYEAHM